MKTILIAWSLLTVISCGNIKKAVSKNISSVTAQASSNQYKEVQRDIEYSLISNNKLTEVSGTNGEFDRVIEEQVLEYVAAGSDSNLLPGSSVDRVIKTKRRIRERGSASTSTQREVANRDSVHQQYEQFSSSIAHSQKKSEVDTRSLTREVQRRGLSGFLWVSGLAVVVLALWWKGRQTGIFSTKK